MALVLVRNFAAMIVLMAAGAAYARAETPAAFCQRIGTDDAARPIPEALVPAVNALFDLRMPADEAVATTVFRCAGGRVTVCTTGANLPCGKANTSRKANPGMRWWCHDNPDTRFIPAAATGRDTIYAWRCRDGEPMVVRQRLHVDPRGFVAEFWKVLHLGPQPTTPANSWLVIPWL